MILSFMLEMRCIRINLRCCFLFREDKLVERAKSLKINAGTEPDADLGPMISKQVDTYFECSNIHALSTVNC